MSKVNRKICYKKIKPFINTTRYISERGMRIWNYNIISILLSLGVYYAPAFLGGIIPIDKIAKVFKEINLAEAVKVEGMFINPITYNIFGNPTLYSTVIISLVVVSIPVAIYLIKYLGKKQAI